MYMKGSTRSTVAMMAVAALFAALRWPDGEAPQQAGWKLLATSPYLTVNDGLLNADEVSQLLDMASEQDMAPCTGNWKAGSYEDTRSCGLLPIGNNSLLLSLRAKLGTELGVDVSDRANVSALMYRANVSAERRARGERPPQLPAERHLDRGQARRARLLSRAQRRGGALPVSRPRRRQLPGELDLR